MSYVVDQSSRHLCPHMSQSFSFSGSFNGARTGYEGLSPRTMPAWEAAMEASLPAVSEKSPSNLVILEKTSNETSKHEVLKGTTHRFERSFQLLIKNIDLIPSTIPFSNSFATAVPPWRGHSFWPVSPPPLLQRLPHPPQPCRHPWPCRLLRRCLQRMSLWETLEVATLRCLVQCDKQLINDDRICTVICVVLYTFIA